VDVLVRLDELWPDQRSVHALLMESLLRAGRAGEARQRLGSWLERHPRELEARMTLAQMQQEAGDWSGAVATLRAAPAADRGNLELRRRLALALVHDTELDAARGELQDLVATGAGEP